MHIKPGERQAAAPRMATSTCAGLLDATISLNRGIQQLFPSAAIARRMLPTVFAVLRRRRQGSKTDKTSEIAVIAQCTLQPLRRPVHVTEFAATAQRNDFRQRFQHVAETFDLDPQAVTARRAQGFQTPSLADQPLAPAVEFTRAIGFQPLGVIAPRPARQPWPLLDPAC